MMFFVRPRDLALFLAVFALGFWVLSLVPLPYWGSFILGCLWLAGAVWAGWKLFPRPTDQPAVGPSPEATQEAGQNSEAEPAPEPVVADEEPLPPVPESGPRLPLDEWREVLDLIEADWSKPDDQAPVLQSILGNTSFIRENVLKAYEIADNLAGTAQTAFTLSEKVQKGIKVVTEALVESMKQTEILSVHSQRVTAILELLEEVSDKIHVLSINASIVSARAGASGRGFEVVAKEIRSLAKETEHSLGDIVEVIELFRGSIARVIQVVKDADLETEQERDSLIQVAGSLQGVILGVEIVKAVTGFARETAVEQETVIKGLGGRDRGPSDEVRQRVAAVRAQLKEWNSKE